MTGVTLPDMLKNPFRGRGLPPQQGLAEGTVAADPAAAMALLDLCPAAARTPLRSLTALASKVGADAVFAKDESARMGLGSFKALGACHAIARDAADALGGAPDGTADWGGALAGRTYICASAGNHGMSVAAGARLFGAAAEIHLSATVPESFAVRLQERGARVVRSGEDYEASMAAAMAAAEANDWILLSDSSWLGYTELPRRVMEGYLVMGAEIADEMPAPPDCIFLQAGVGGLAAAMAALFRARWGDAPSIVVVEPTAAPALMESIQAGKPVCAEGPVSNMGRLDCKEPSHLALAELARSADHFVLVNDGQAVETVETLEREAGVKTTPSGAAGLAAMLHAGADLQTLGLPPQGSALVIVSEGDAA